jgi:hypothetical protein
MGGQAKRYWRGGFEGRKWCDGETDIGTGLGREGEEVVFGAVPCSFDCVVFLNLVRRVSRVKGLCELEILRASDRQAFSFSIWIDILSQGTL